MRSVVVFVSFCDIKNNNKNNKSIYISELLVLLQSNKPTKAAIFCSQVTTGHHTGFMFIVLTAKPRTRLQPRPKCFTFMHSTALNLYNLTKMPVISF